PGGRESPFLSEGDGPSGGHEPERRGYGQQAVKKGFRPSVMLEREALFALQRTSASSVRMAAQRQPAGISRLASAAHCLHGKSSACDHLAEHRLQDAAVAVVFDVDIGV